MNKFGIPDSVINSVNAVLEAGNKLPRQLKDPKKETMMGYEYKPGKVRNQVVDKKDVKDKEKKGYFHTEDAVDEDDIAEAMEVHLKPHGTAGTHYTVHKVGKKLAKHGGIKVGEKLSDTQVDDARDSGVKVRHVKEDAQVDEAAPLPTEKQKATTERIKARTARAAADAWNLKGKVKRHTVSRDKRLGKEEVEFDEKIEEGGMKRIATQAMLGEPGSGLETFKKRSAEKNKGGVKQNGSVNQDKSSNMGNLGKKQKSVPQNGSVNQNEEVIDEKKLDPVDHKALKGSHAQRKDKDIDNDGSVDDTDTYLHHRRKTVKKAMKEAEEMNVKKTDGPDHLGGKKLDASKECPTVSEGVGDEKVRSSAQAAQLAKHYYAKAKAAQASGSKEEAAKMMSAAKTFYRKSERDAAEEKSGHQKAKSESTENVGIGEYYFNELEIEEIEAADDIVTEVTKSGKYAGKRKSDGSMPGESARSGQRVTKTEKEGPEHIVMQARKVVSLGHKHGGVEFKDGSKAKVDPKHAAAALNRYNQGKPAEKEHMQATMNHSHDGLKHVASGKPMDHPDNPHKPQTRKLAGSERRTDRAVGLMKHPDDN